MKHETFCRARRYGGPSVDRLRHCGCGAVPGCPQPLVSAIEENTFSVVNLAEFEGRVYLYATKIPRQPGRFEPFDLWVIEGVYGRPLVQSSGPMTLSSVCARTATSEQPRRASSRTARAARELGARLS